MLTDICPRPLLTQEPIDYRDLKTDEVRALYNESLDALSSGRSLASIRGLGVHDMHARLAAGRELAESGDFESAFSIAFELYLLDPREYRHAYLAALCMHQLDEPESALAFYFAADSTGMVPEAVYGMAQCFETMGDHPSAIRHFDRVGEMTRGLPQYGELREAAGDAAHKLYTALKPALAE